MNATGSALFALTARDLMRSPVEVIPAEMTLRAAAQLLYRKQVGGAPVIDAEGRCIGILSASDIVRWFQGGATPPGEALPGRMHACSFQAPGPDSGGVGTPRCTLPAGVCPAQVEQPLPGGGSVLLCPLPHCAFVDWQMLAELPDEGVAFHMTRDLVVVDREVAITDVARMLVDAHIHRVVVVDAGSRPVGIVTATDVLAAVARQGLPR